MNGWWYTATRDQKLAQIDGGIELGMNARQVAMVTGALPATVQAFACAYDRHFPGITEIGRQKIAQAQKRIWAERRRELPSEAFAIFGDHSTPFELEF